MKKFIHSVAVVVAVVVVFCVKAHSVYRYGLTPSQISDKFSDSEYSVEAGSRTKQPVAALAGNATFYGYATDYSIKMATGDSLNSFANIWVTAGASNTVVIPTMTYFAGDNTYQTMFVVPIDSPCVFNIQLFGQVTAQYTIGGYKRDIKGQ